MHLSTTQTRALGNVMRLLAQADDADALRGELALPMLDLLQADTYVSFTWNVDAQRFDRVKALNMSPDNLRNWDAYYRFIDPLTMPMMARRHPTLATQILHQDDLGKTEFFNDFLARDQMHWGINVYVFAQAHCMGDMRIWRRRARGNFDAHEMSALRLVEPAFAAALARLQWQSASRAEPQARENVVDLLRRTSALSQREAEVAALLLSGCPDKRIASRMGVEPRTVRFHLGNAFRKLRVDNRTELAARVQSLVDAQGADATQR